MKEQYLESSYYKKGYKSGAFQSKAGQQRDNLRVCVHFFGTHTMVERA